MAKNNLNRDLERFIEKNRRNENITTENNSKTVENQENNKEKEETNKQTKEKVIKRFSNKINKIREIFKSKEIVKDVDGLEVYYDANEGKLKLLSKVKSLFKK